MCSCSRKRTKEDGMHKLYICMNLFKKLENIKIEIHYHIAIWNLWISYKIYTLRAEIFAVVLFSRISRVKPSRKFPLQFMSIYSNDNISKIAKLTPPELPHLAKTAKITVRENNGVYSMSNLVQFLSHFSKTYYYSCLWPQ